MAVKKVLITGVSGLIGSSTYLDLAAAPEQYEVYGLGRRRALSERVPVDRLIDVPRERFFECDVADMTAVQRAVEGMDVVVHMAADPSGRNWESLLNNNLIGAYNLFEACRLAQVGRLVGASTIQVSTGQRQQEPYKAVVERRAEDIPVDFAPLTVRVPAEPRNLYGSTKVWLESLARTYAHSCDMSCLCIRIGWVVAEDRPPNAQAADVWCSQRDIVQLIRRCIDAPRALRCEIFYGMSNNDNRWVDLEDARLKVGYEPKDRAEDFF